MAALDALTDLDGILVALADDITDVLAWSALADWGEESCPNGQERNSLLVLRDEDGTHVWARAKALRAAFVTLSPDSHCLHVEFHGGYVEPGYASTDGVPVATGNWNADGEDTAPERFGELLEALGVTCEWSDEWTSCADCALLVRTQPDCHHWHPAYSYRDGDVVCHQCHSPDQDDDA